MSRVPIHDHSNIHQGGKIRASTSIAGMDLTGPGASSGGGTSLPIAAVDVSVTDTSGWFTGTEVETALAELAAKAIGYQAHGNLGSTETFDAATGWHSGTLNANCTFTLTGAPTGTVSSLFLELIQDGTGGWTITLPAAVTNKTDLEAAQVTTLSTTSFLVLLSRDAGTTWYGGWWGGAGSSLTIKDEGSSLATAATSIDFVGAGVTASGVLAAKTVTIPGGATASDTGAWVPVMDGSGAVVTDGFGQAVMTFVTF